MTTEVTPARRPSTTPMCPPGKRRSPTFCIRIRFSPRRVAAGIPAAVALRRTPGGHRATTAAVGRALAGADRWTALAAGQAQEERQQYEVARKPPEHGDAHKAAEVHERHKIRQRQHEEAQDEREVRVDEGPPDVVLRCSESCREIESRA